MFIHCCGFKKKLNSSLVIIILTMNVVCCLGVMADILSVQKFTVHCPLFVSITEVAVSYMRLTTILDRLISDNANIV